MRILFLLTFLISAQIVAQDALRIKYGKQTKWDISTELQEKNPDLAIAMKKAMQEVVDYELIFFNNEAQYVFVEKIDNKQIEEGNRTSVSFGIPNEKIYSNYNTGQQLRAFSANGKYSVIRTELPSYKWELTRETKNILGIKVRKAILSSEKTEEIAWYAPQIPYKAGPENIWGLPGLILEYRKDRKTSKGIRSTYIFTQALEHLDSSAVNIEKPDESISISQEEFKEQQKIFMEKLNEMNSQGVDTSD